MKTLHKEEEHLIIIPDHYHHNEEKNHKPNVRQRIDSLKERLLESLAAAAALAAIIAVIFPAYQYWSETPKLKLETQALELRPDKDVIQILDGIESDYQDITEMIIVNLRDEIEMLLEEILKIEIPQIGEYELKIDEKGVDTSQLEPEEINSINLSIDRAKQKIANLKKETLNEYPENKSNVERLERIEKSLSELQKNISTKRNAMNKKRVVINLLVENHSKSKNGIRETAVIRFYENKDVHFPVILKLKKNDYNDISIDGNSFKLFRFESSLMENIENDKTAIDSVFKNQYDYIFVLEDLKGNLWPEEGTALNYKLDSHTEKLSNKTESILKEKYASWMPWK